MAQDAPDLRLQPPDSPPVLEDRLSDIPSIAEHASTHSHGGQNSDPRSAEPFRNSTLDPALSVPRTSEGSAMEDGDNTRPSGKKVRTVPAWVQSVQYPEEEAESSVTSRLLPSEPNEAVVAQHNHSPYATSKPNHGQSAGENSGEGRGIPPRRESRWMNFSKSITHPRDPNVEEKSVTPEWLDENHGDYSQPWRGQRDSWDCEDTDDPLRKKRRRQIWFKRFHNTLLKSPMVPLILRMTVWCFSLTALALGSSIQHLSREYLHPQGPSALMAIIVDAVALVYLLYITWDEYTAKPLGLRSPAAKARLVLLDIFFIVFDSANLSLAFESLSTISGACTLGEINQEVTPKNDRICDRQIALACVLLIALLAWLTTFAISVLRLVERVAS